MSKSSDDGGLDVFTLSDRSLYRWLDQQDARWHELPDEREFARLEYAPKRKRLSHTFQRLRSLIPKRRRYAYQSI